MNPITMKMEKLPATISYSNDDEMNLQLLLDMFGAVVSLEDIASAYSQASRDLQIASDILCDLQGSNSETSDKLSVDEPENSQSAYLISSSESVTENAQFKAKPKKCSTSMGTVSSVIGREYGRSRPSTKEFSEGTKPLKLNINDFPIAERLDEKDSQDTATRKEAMHQDVAEFLFQMLGNGFDLNMDIIQDVVGQCGYDVKMSMEKLLNMSASAFHSNENIPSSSSEKPMEKNLDPRRTQSQETSRNINLGSSRANSITGGVQSTKKKDKSELEKEILEAWFPERTLEEPERIPIVREPRESPYVVVGPPKEPVAATRPIVTRLHANSNDDEETEDDFEAQKIASKEDWETMAEYYRAAVEAFIAGDLQKAHKLEEKGHFYMKKAREANEKAAQMLIRSKDVEEQMCIDLQAFEEVSAAKRFLRTQLTFLCGIPSISNLRVIVGDEGKGARSRKRQITRLLEKESITWSEEENGRVMVIPVGKINPKRLSFAKK